MWPVRESSIQSKTPTKKQNKLASPKFWRHPYGIKLPSNGGASCQGFALDFSPNEAGRFLSGSRSLSSRSAHQVAPEPARGHRGNDSQVLLWGPVPGGGETTGGKRVCFCSGFWHVSLVLQVGQSSPSSPSRGTNPQWRMSSPWAQSLRVIS